MGSLGAMWRLPTAQANLSHLGLIQMITGNNWTVLLQRVTMCEFPFISTPSCCWPKNDAKRGSDISNITLLKLGRLLSSFMLCPTRLLVIFQSLLCALDTRDTSHSCYRYYLNAHGDGPRKNILARSPLCRLEDWGRAERSRVFSRTQNWWEKGVISALSPES